ncbi:hypothetical protein [Ornithinimicrobium sp. W1665]|uniref:hypothetical protein n=1 Tax=Ornithinimicrobium sp. W1665 TaxID=3416666 RepID=UPI003D6C2914
MNERPKVITAKTDTRTTSGVRTRRRMRKTASVPAGSEGTSTRTRRRLSGRERAGVPPRRSWSRLAMGYAVQPVRRARQRRR